MRARDVTRLRLTEDCSPPHGAAEPGVYSALVALRSTRTSNRSRVSYLGQADDGTIGTPLRQCSRPRHGIPYVFDFGAENSRHRLDEFWRKLRAGARLPSVRLHDLRHSYASFAARGSETLPMIGRLLGHAKVGSSARYAHLDDTTALSIAERLGFLIAGRLLTAV
jgi:integrase